MKNYSDIQEGNISSIKDNDGWVLGPFKNKMCKTYTESVHFRWCDWKAGETRNQTHIGRDHDWCEAVFLIKGEMFVKYNSETVLLHEYGDYAVHDSNRWPKFRITRDCVAIVLRWKSKYEGKRYGNVSNYTRFYNNWIVGPFVDQNEHPHFYSDDLEFKWSIRHQVPYLREAKQSSDISNPDWKSMCVLTDGEFSINFGDPVCKMNKQGDFVYWHPNVPHINYTNTKSTLFTIRWNDS
jgi:hypothetical protein